MALISNDSANDQSGRVEHVDELWTSLNFLAPLPRYDYEKPYSMDCTPPEGLPRTNVECIPFATCIRNARGYEHTFSTSSASFEWFQHKLAYALENEESIDRYLRDMENVLLQRTGANMVFAYDYVLRQEWEKGKPRPARIKTGVKKPIFGVHLDIAAAGAETRIRYHLPDQCDELLAGRYRIMNCWRPLIDIIESHPIAVCDSRTLASEDLIPSDVVFPHLEISAYEVWYNSRQQWYYLNKQRKDEVLLMTNYDSANPNVRCAHSAFEDPSTPQHAPERKSVEVRFMVFDN